MLAAFTDDGRGVAGANPLLQAHKAALDSLEGTGSGERENALKKALEGASIDNLKRSLRKQVEALNEVAAMRLSQEFTRRGIAPAFRGIPIRDDPWWQEPTDEVKFVLLCSDLQWLATQYPRHKTAWKRAQVAFDPDKLETAARYLCWNDRGPGQIALALGLTTDQQKELAYIQFLNIRRLVDRLHGRRPFAEAAIRSDVDSRPWKSTGSKEDTIQRRLALWHCAELANKKPQRTADLYRMLTDKNITRGIVAVQLVKLQKVRRAPL